jgi:hypothetical protein
VTTLLAGCSAGIAGQPLAATPGSTSPGVHAVGQPSRGGSLTTVTPATSAPAASVAAPPTTAGSPESTPGGSRVPATGDAPAPSSVDTSESTRSTAPATQRVDPGVLLGRMRVGAATITGEVIAESISMREDITSELTYQEDLTIKASRGGVTAFDARIAGTDLREIGAGDAARPLINLRWVQQRTFIGPQRIITSLGIANDQRRPWYEVTSATDPAVGRFVVGMVHDPAVGVLLPLSADLVGAAFQLTDLGSQPEPVGTHEFRMFVDLLNVPALVKDLTADQVQQLRSGGEPIMTVFVWLDAQDRPVKLIAGYHSFEEDVRITETATHLNEAIRIEVPPAEDIVAG